MSKVTSRQSLREIADLQEGYFTSQQAKSAGFMQCNHDYHVSCGNWKKIDRGLFRLPGYQDSLESEVIRWTFWAAGQAQERVVALSHESALFYYGLLPTRPLRVHLCVSSLRKNPENEHCQLHHESVPAEECVQKTGFRIVSPFAALRSMKSDLLYCERWGMTLQQAVHRGLITQQQAMELGDYYPADREFRPPVMTTDGTADSLRTDTRLSRGLFEKSRRAERMLIPGRTFTMVEMLIVVAIICILSALLMPALRSAIGSARAMACLNNQKNLGVATSAYAGDNRGFVPTWNYLNKYAANYGVNYTLTYADGWQSATVFSPLAFFVAGGYIDGLTRARAYPLSADGQSYLATEPVSTVCPEIALDRSLWGGWQSWCAGGSYGFNKKVGSSLSIDSNYKYLRPFTQMPRPSQRFVLTDGLRIHIGVYSFLAFNHNAADNFLFGDGHSQSWNADDVPLDTGNEWDTTAIGKDTANLPPW